MAEPDDLGHRDGPAVLRREPLTSTRFVGTAGYRPLRSLVEPVVAGESWLGEDPPERQRGADEPVDAARTCFTRRGQFLPTSSSGTTVCAMARYVVVIHYPTFGGPHNEFLRLAGPLSDRGWEGTVVLPTESEAAAARLAGSGLEVIPLPLHRLRATARPSAHLALAGHVPVDVARISSVARSRDADVVVNMGLVNPHAAIAGRLAGRGVVWQLVDLSTPLPVRRALAPLVRSLAHVCMTAGRAVGAGHPGIERLGENLVVFRPPVDLDEFAPDAGYRDAARRELGLAADDLVVGMTANFSPEKDHATFVRAAAELHRRDPRTRFVLLGATYAHRRAANDALWRLARELGVPFGERIVHRDAGDRVAYLAQAFDVFWLTSLAEGLPTVVSEAMALELPVVATDVGGVPELVTDRETGFLVPASDVESLVARTLDLLRDPALRLRLGEKARARVADTQGSQNCADVHAAAFAQAAALAGRRES